MWCWWEDLAIFAEEIGLYSFMSLDGRKHIRSLKSAWLILLSELKACALPFTERNNEELNPLIASVAPI